MKTFHVSIITGVGMAIVVSFGMTILIFRKSLLSIEAKASCNETPNASIDAIRLNKTIWISVMEINKNQTTLDCTSLNQHFLSSMPKIKQALGGADQCFNGNYDLCTVPSGMSIETTFDFGVRVRDYWDYQETLTRNEAVALFSNIKLSSKGICSYGDLEYKKKYYQLVQNTNRKDRPPQTYGEIVEKISYPPPQITQGQSIRYTITMKTLATYGKPAEIQFNASSMASDSGLKLTIDPDTLVIPERSQSNTTLTITATPGTLNGTYPISITGKTPEGQSVGICGSDCPTVKVGDSDWSIVNNYGGSYGFQGGNKPQDWLKFETVLDKNNYYLGDIVQISNYMVNESPNKITLNDRAEILVNVYNNDKNGTYHYYYFVQAMYDGKPIILEPHSKIILARPLHWDQMSYHGSNSFHRVKPGVYHVDVSFGSSYQGAVWDNDITMKIK